MDEDSCKDRQENERAALKAIYGDELVEVVTDCNGTESWEPLQYIISLRSQESSNTHPCSTPAVRLRITCPADYPLIVPDIQLEDWKHISNDLISSLKNELIYNSKKLKGEVMIFELAQYVENFLHKCHQPRYESFYEEMMIRNKTQQEKARQKKQAEDEKKKQEVRQQIQVKEQAVKKALRRRQSSVKSLDEEFDSECTITRKNESPSSKPPSDDIDDRNERTEEYTPWNVNELGQSRYHNEFEHLRFLGKGAFGDVIKVRNKLDDGLYAVKRIELNPSEKQLNKKITREVKLLSRLNHENVVRYYNSWIEETPIKSNLDVRSRSPTTKINDKVLEIERSFNWNMGSSDSDDSSDWVLFRSSSKSHCEETAGDTSEVFSSTRTVNLPLVYMYIQMELCDKSTLRLAIDDDKLYANVNRVWRLFREIVEGLCHIHQQGIIHRDLKPVNIFIGNDDHVKIGDFGLATTILLQKQTVREATTSLVDLNIKTEYNSPLQTDWSQTGQVGTTLYVAPELNNYATKLQYNQKVDIYSLGIIFYEMCHPPMHTGMERFQNLTELRKSMPIFSKEFPYDEDSCQQKLIRWMLQFDVDKRPSSQEVLESSFIPPPKHEEREVVEMIRRTLSNPQTKNYKFLIASCFHQPVQPSLDATYNMSCWRSTGFISNIESITNKLRTVFQRHGAISFLPPLLTPGGQDLESSACLMTRLGSIVHASYNLQFPFARYLAHNSHVSSMKRYAIDKVYRERQAGVHPRENYECSFDIVTPTMGDLMPEFELLCVIWEILNQFPSILGRNCVIYMNHVFIITAIFKHCGILEEEMKSRIFTIFQSYEIEKQDLESLLKCTGLSERCWTTLLQFLDNKGPLNSISSELQLMLKDEHIIADCRNGLLELERIMHFCEQIGVTCPVLVNLGFIRNTNYYSGALLQVVFNQKNRPKQTEKKILLTGGRYDSLVQHIKETLSRDDGKMNQFVTGFMLSLDKFSSSIENDDIPSTIDVLVCAVGKLVISTDKLLLLRDLWASGVKTSFINTMETLEDIQLRCREMGIPFIIILKETESGFARIRTLSKDRYYEKKLSYCDLLEYIYKNKSTCIESSGLSKIENKSQSPTEGPYITFITPEKLTSGIRRRYESQILNNLSSLLKKFVIKVKVDIVAVAMEGDTLKAVAQHIDSSTNEHEPSFIAKKYPRHKKCMIKLFNHIEEIKRISQSPVVIIYSLPDSVYKVLFY